MYARCLASKILCKNQKGEKNMEKLSREFILNFISVVLKEETKNKLELGKGLVITTEDKNKYEIKVERSL